MSKNLLISAIENEWYRGSCHQFIISTYDNATGRYAPQSANAFRWCEILMDQRHRFQTSSRTNKREDDAGGTQGPRGLTQPLFPTNIILDGLKSLMG
ncbi:MAG: hypothetical protein R2827_08635 [Bdellovibrionales bacterium]